MKPGHFPTDQFKRQRHARRPETINTTMARSFIKLIFSCIGTIRGQSAARIVGFEGKTGMTDHYPQELVHHLAYN